MARKDIIMISQREIKRLHVIHKVLDKRLKQVEAGDILQISSRQVRRIVKRIRVEGDEGIGHKSRGKASNRRLPKKVKEKVIRLYKETLRNWLIESGDWKKVRKGRLHRKWRERKGYIGEMIQMDGSHHDWLEGRGPELVLMAYIDDALH